MKQRITYLLPQGSELSHKEITLKDDHLQFSKTHRAALEKRVTVGLSELPDELISVLRDCHELHIRWSSPLLYHLTPPLVSRIPPGLHVFFTPRKAETEVHLCPLIQELFGSELRCYSIAESFSRPAVLSERFAASSTYQYYHLLPTLDVFRQYAENQLCASSKSTPKLHVECLAQAAFLEHAASVDMDFDIISHAVTLTALWTASDDAAAHLKSYSIPSTITKFRNEDSVEVGILQGEKADPEEPEELSLGGYLTVLEEDDKPSATIFSFPSRHHPLASDNQQTFITSFQHPTGLHPTLQLTFPSASTLQAPKDTCALHAYLTLPSSLFVDKYQFSDKLFLASQNLKSLRAISGEQDLEAPDWIVKTWGSAALFELALPDNEEIRRGPNGEWTVSIPTHLRYLASASNNTIPGSEYSYNQRTIAIAPPVVFWACRGVEGLKFPTNPFDRVNIGYDGLFGPRTMFYHIPPSSNNSDGMLLTELSVPVLEAEGAKRWVPAATAVVVLIGFMWVLWQLFQGTKEGGAKKTHKKKE